jgi:hypothetical protein
MAMLRRWILAISLVLLMGLSQGTTQSSDGFPLLDMLNFVPVEDFYSEPNIIYYADVVTSIETRPGTPLPQTLADWEAMMADDLDGAYISALPLTLPGRQYLVTMIQDDGESTGLRYFDIERALWFGNPPGTRIILEGDFDTDAIVRAYTEDRHELITEDENGILLCSVNGCDDGETIDLRLSNRANLFGGEFGRVEPIYLQETRILNSPIIDNLEQMQAAAAGDIPSMASLPQVQALATVAYEQGALRQAVIVTPIPLDVAALLGFNTSPEEREALAERLGLNDPNAGLPPYPFFMVANTAQIDEGVEGVDEGHILIPYDTEADAQEAADKINEAFDPENEVLSLRESRPIAEVAAEYGDVQGAQVIYNATTQQYVVVFTITRPLPSALTAVDDGTPILSRSGLSFQYLLDSVFSRDITWLAPRSTEDE